MQTAESEQDRVHEPLTQLKQEQLRKRFQSDLSAADFQWSMFMAALNSYRHDTVLRPYPYKVLNPTNAATEEKDFKTLERIAEKVPKFEQLVSRGFSDVDENTVNLLHWAIASKTLSIESRSKNFYDVIKEKTGEIATAPVPNYIFEVIYHESQSSKFEERKAGNDLIYAYHGTRVENIHSILNLGLHSHMNKNSLFGEGTYLSAELSMCMMYAQTGKSWDHSLLGDKLSTVLVCEIIDHPSVKCQVTNGVTSNQRARSRAPGSMGGEVPDKYYVVTNNEYIRVKYIYVYTAKKKSISSRRPSWAYEHRFFLMMMFYALVLLGIGLYNSRFFQSYIKRRIK